MKNKWVWLDKYAEYIMMKKSLKINCLKFDQPLVIINNKVILHQNIFSVFFLSCQSQPANNIFLKYLSLLITTLTYFSINLDITCEMLPEISSVTPWPRGAYILKSDLWRELSVLFYYSEKYIFEHQDTCLNIRTNM